MNLFRVYKNRQAGLSLMVVMMALIIISIGAIGMIRLVDTSSLVAGNMAFKQSTTSAADTGAERGMLWLQNKADLTLDDEVNGYYASSLATLDVTGKSTLATRALVDWGDDDCAYAATDSYASCKKASPNETTGDYVTRYIITRMCKTTGSIDATGNSCAKPIALNSGSASKGSLDYNNSGASLKTALPYYRVVVRSVGPRNTVSFTETYVHFYPL